MSNSSNQSMKRERRQFTAEQKDVIVKSEFPIVPVTRELTMSINGSLCKRIAFVGTTIINRKNTGAGANNGDLLFAVLKDDWLLRQLLTLDRLDPPFFQDRHCQLFAQEISL